jgi:hypothetical protein
VNSNRLRELLDEFRAVFAGRNNLLDTIVPPLLFLIVNTTLGLDYAIWLSLGVALAITGLRLARRQSLAYAFGGLGGVGFAILVSQVLGRSEGYFLPGIVNAGLTALLCLVSVVVQRPLVAWTSFIARRWPLGWYWHPKVRPVYSEVTGLWAVFFSLKLLVQLNLFQSQSGQALAVVSVLTGWPATIVLLVISYLYGTWRLKNLGGPSVEEYRSNSPSPWISQRRGF